MTHLSPREAEVAYLIGVECLTAKDAARRLGVSFRTVEQHKTNIFEKLGVSGVVALARYLALEECKHG